MPRRPSSFDPNFDTLEERDMDLIPEPTPKLFTLRQRGDVVFGLEKVPLNNANIQRLSTEKPLAKMELGEEIVARDTAGDHYLLKRER